MGYIDKQVEKEWFRDRYHCNREWVQQYKLEQGCADCGYAEHHAGLEFDHVKSRLRGTVSSQVGKSRRVIEEEIARCDVVCGTCHRIRTWNRRQEARSSIG